MIWLSLALCFNGFTALCLSMERHHKQVFATSASLLERWLFRIGGWVALALSIMPCVSALGISIGLSLWAVLLTFAGLLVMALLSYWPRVLVAAAFAAPAIAGPVLLL